MYIFLSMIIVALLAQIVRLLCYPRYTVVWQYDLTIQVPTWLEALDRISLGLGAFGIVGMMVCI